LSCLPAFPRCVPPEPPRGDEGKIRSIVETAHDGTGLLRDVVHDGRDLAARMGISYTASLRARMDVGYAEYGPWDVHDGRDYRREALKELQDAAIYLAAEMVQVREERGGCRKKDVP